MNRRIEPLKPILTAHLFPKIDGMLIELLRSLAPEDWEKQTVSPKWKVKDVAAHLLDTSLRGISIGRDGYVAESPRITAAADLGAFINRLNSKGVTVYRRLSPVVLIGLVESPRNHWRSSTIPVIRMRRLSTVRAGTARSNLQIGFTQLRKSPITGIIIISNVRS